MELGVSVVICTYNGATLLPETLRHIALQRVRPEIDWEVIIVDNASTDDTSKLVVAEWEKYQNPVRFSLLYQPKQGLTYARELSLEKSRYEFVLFCDDDNWLNPDYINLAYDLMLQHPSIGVLGGQGELIFETPPPLWAVGHSLLANGPQASRSGKVNNNVVYGAGCVMRRSAFEMLIKAGFKTMLTDRMGDNLSSGGDYELCFAIALAGYDIWYDEKMTFKHFMPSKRISWDYFIRLFNEGAQSFQVIVPYRIRINMGSKSIMAFNLNYTKIVLSYTKKMLLVLLKTVSISRHTDEAKFNTLKLIYLKLKILSFANYFIMQKNFLRILQFEQGELNTFKKRKKSFYTKMKI